MKYNLIFEVVIDTVQIIFSIFLYVNEMLLFVKQLNANFSSQLSVNQ